MRGGNAGDVVIRFGVGIFAARFGADVKLPVSPWESSPLPSKMTSATIMRLEGEVCAAAGAAVQPTAARPASTMMNQRTETLTWLAPFVPFMGETSGPLKRMSHSFGSEGNSPREYECQGELTRTLRGGYSEPLGISQRFGVPRPWASYDICDPPLPPRNPIHAEPPPS